MTTPEKFRRRQLIEGTALILLGVLTLGMGALFNARDAQQSECLRHNISALVSNIEFRANLAAREGRIDQRLSAINRREAKATKAVLLVYAEAAGIRRETGEEFTPAEQDRLEEKLIDRLLVYDKVIDEARQDIADIRKKKTEIRERRAQRPVPAFPEGTCT